MNLPTLLVLSYLAHGIAQHFCLIAQPLEFYLLKQQNYNAVEVASVTALLMVPWMIKPLYGVFSDLVPVAGMHRKPLLIVSSIAAFLGFSACITAPTLPNLLTYLFVTSAGMAISTVVLCALVADQTHKRPGDNRTLFSLQAGAYYSTSIVASLVGGYLCHTFTPAMSLQVASTGAALACLLLCIVSLQLREHKTTAQQTANKYFRLVRSTLWSVKFRGVAMFVFLWNLSPGLGTPLYFYYTQTLHFSQEFIGRLGAVNSIGMVCGAGLFRLLATTMRFRNRMSRVAVIAGVLSNLSFMVCVSEPIALTLEFVRGVTTMLCILTIYGCAADVCPKRITATTFGVLIAIYNIGAQLGALIGAQFFINWSGGAIQPLAAVSALSTLACLWFCPNFPGEGRIKPRL